jgi:hypothetical protein
MRKIANGDYPLQMAATAILSRSSDRGPTAMFCGNDLLALGVLARDDRAADPGPGHRPHGRDRSFELTLEIAALVGLPLGIARGSGIAACGDNGTTLE